MTDIGGIEGALELDRVDGAPELEVLHATCASDAARAAFWSSLLAEAGLQEGRLKSRPGRSIELYQDAIARHVTSGRVAMSALDARGQLQHLSFAELDAAATSCASAWSLAGLEPGDILAIVAPLGFTWLIAFAAALRLGLTVSCLASLGEGALRRRLGALEPKRVVFEGRPVPDELAGLAISVTRSSSGHAPPPRAYGPEQELARLFSPLRAPLDRPTPLLAETALLWGLRDARFAYRLGPDAGLATPGLSLEQHQPAIILATLLVGARFVELPLSAVTQNPACLAQPFITAIGVSPALRDALRRAPAGALPALRGWWRSVDEPLDWEAWRDFIEKNGLQGRPSSNLLVDAATGGAVLTSARRPGVASSFVVPSPGAPFVLSELSSGAPSSTGTGVFATGAETDPKNPGWFLVAKRASEYLYGGTLSPRRAGRVYPEQEVVDCVSEVPLVDGACVVPVAAGDPGPRWHFVLVVFAPALEEREHGALKRAVEHALRTQLGADFMPDQVLVYALAARRDGKKLDLNWCARQYSAGFLERKAKHPVFQRLTALRASLRKEQDDVR